MKLVEFAQLWEGEQHTLAKLAASVPDNGVITEIGTAQGGSAYIFYHTASSRGVNIYSYDITPSEEAFDHLKGTNVQVFAKSSLEGAKAWPSTVGKPIDLLFIDGSHAFQHVFEDYNAWLPHMREGGTIAFHDHDSIERGGLIHFGSYIAQKTVVRCGLLEGFVHRDRLLFGQFNHPEKAQLQIGECLQTFVDLGRQITDLIERDYSNWGMVGNEEMFRFLKGCLNMDQSAAPSSPDSADPEGKYLVFSHPLEAGIEEMASRRVPDENIVPVNSLQACYIIDHALQNSRDHLLDTTLSKPELFRWEEILFMYEHAFGPSYFPWQVDDLFQQNIGPDRLSQLIAREQVRLVFLSRIFATFFENWTP